MKCLICTCQNVVATRLNPEFRVASDVVKGHIQHLCLRHTASALPLLTKQQQLYFVSNLKLGAIDQFCLYPALLGEETVGSFHKSVG